MGSSVEIARQTVELRLLGPLEVRRGGHALPLPGSRKVRALLGFLALANAPVAREQLCDLLWDAPGDPRAELRWCLSKLRALVDDPGHPRLHAEGGSVWLAPDAGCVDATEVLAALQRGVTSLGAAEVASLASRFSGSFLEGLEIERCPVFEAWLRAQRRRFLDARVTLLRRIAAVGSEEEALRASETWVQLLPQDAQAHANLIDVLAKMGRVRDAESQLASATRLFEAEGLDVHPLRAAWHRARMPKIAVEAAREAIPERRRASIAVMPFAERNSRAGYDGVGRALAHDIVARLAKLRSMFVIAQGSTLALHERGIGEADAGRILDVDYLASGSIATDGRGLRVEVQLAEPRNGRIVWAETIVEPAGDALALLDEIGNRIVAAIASEVETQERNRAILRPPDVLDAWTALHRGLWHAYRFNRTDNQRAQALFETAVRLDPTFARAHAGLSFAHFQNAFQGWGPREAEEERAYAAASQALLADDRDPAAHWAMGRALWLGGDERALPELEQAVELSPNFAQGHYTLAFVHSQAGDPQVAISAADHSRALSPFDPLLFAMLASRSMALARLGRFDEAAAWAVQAASRPNAHAHIRAIAALNLALAGAAGEARKHVAAIHTTAPGYGVEDFFRAFRLGPDAEQMYRRHAAAAGLA